MLLRPGAVGRLGQPARTARALFSPSSLFANGEQGVFYDISDTATLFQDSAGTTPVTAVEQTVGLILDKSKGLVLGSDVVLNGSFDSASNWTLTGTASIAGGELTLAAVNDVATQNVGFVAGRMYEITVVRAGTAVAVCYAAVLGSGAPSSFQMNTAGTYTFRLIAGSGVPGVLRFAHVGGSGAVTIQSVTAKELPGNHAYQTDLAKRPLWSSRVNLLQRTEEFNDAYWTKQDSSISANTTDTTDPLGGNTADKYTKSSASNDWLNTNSGVTIQSGINYKLSICAKKGSEDWFRVTAWANALGVDVYANAWFNLATGQAGSISNGAVGVAVGSEIADLGSGWYRCTLVFRATTGTALFPTFVMVTADAVVTRPAASSFVYIWGADLRVANESNALPPYQRVVTATDYDTTGFPAFLRFDGTNDALVTNSIDFTATDEMSVFAGVRKLADASGGQIAALGNVSAGEWYLYPGNYEKATGSFFTFLGRGAASENGNQAAQATPYAAPITAILSAAGNISGDLNTLSVNAAAGASATGDQGAGNYGNLPLNIGSRNNASLFYNGRLFSLVVLGRTVTPTELTQTEGYVESKTFGKDMNYVLYEPVLGSDGDQITLTAGGDDLFVYQNYE